jgi:hypothetical protein
MAMRSSPPSYTVVPRRRGYWIEFTDRLVSRHPIERFDTEEEAVQRLLVLQDERRAAKRKATFLHPGQPD